MPAKPPVESRAPGRPRWGRWVRRLALFSVLWWILTGDLAGSWYVGVPVVIAGAWLSLSLWADPPLSLLGLLRFMPYFAYHSVAGATDVAMRALQPRMPLQPGIVRHRLRLPPGLSRVAIANVISMLPGTLSADLEEDDVVIHALDMRTDLHAMVIDLEPRIAAMFRLRLEEEK
jgi:multicomponent Na+:H+ antiporter subunit E